MLSNESLGWTGFQYLRCQLSGRLGEFHWHGGERPRGTDNDAANFERKLRFVLRAPFPDVRLSKDYGEMNCIALDVLDLLNSIVSGVVDENLVEVCAMHTDHGSGPPGHSKSDSCDCFSLSSRHRGLKTALCFLERRPGYTFCLVTGPGPSLFSFPPGDLGKEAISRVGKWEHFLEALTRNAVTSQGSSIIPLQAPGLAVELLNERGLAVPEQRASALVNALFKKFRTLLCGDPFRFHEIRLGLSALNTRPAQSVLDVFVSCCPDKIPQRWHEARCGSFPGVRSAMVEQQNHTLCVAIDRAVTESKRLHLLINSSGVFDINDELSDPSPTNEVQSESLVDLLDRNIFTELTFGEFVEGTLEEKASPKEKAEIALMLAKCLSEFITDDIELASHSLNPENILFMSSSATSLDSRGGLYISLRPTQYRPLPIGSPSEFEVGNPTIFSFARLLMEIETGTKIDVQIQPETKQNQANWFRFCGFVNEKKKTSLNCLYLDAVEGCLTLYKDRPRNLAMRSDAGKVLRKVFHNRVIRNLELIVNPQSAKRKRRDSLSDTQHAKRPTITMAHKEGLSKTPFIESGKGAACFALSEAGMSIRAKLFQGSDTSRRDLHVQQERSTIHEQSTHQNAPKHDGRLCEVGNASTLREPSTFTYLKETRESRLEPMENDRVVRIAILDTGIDLRHKEFQNIKTHKNFCGNKEDDVQTLNDVQDLDGHGTQVASIILQLAPRAQLCIARVLDGDVDRGSPCSKTQTGAERDYVTHPSPGTVAEAILWAIDEKVDIINLSLGFDGYHSAVDSAIKVAKKKRILIFAAMANGGVHEQAAWPAKESNLAIGVHSCKDLGATSSGFTPKPVMANYNFMVIGEHIPASGLMARNNESSYVEGTSYATPVAVAIAALILAFANQRRCKAPRNECEEKLLKKGLHWDYMWLNEGMRKVLQAISIESTCSRYLSISHKLLWKDYLDDRDTYGKTNEAMRKHGWKVIRDALWDMAPVELEHV